MCDCAEIVIRWSNNLCDEWRASKGKVTAYSKPSATPNPTICISDEAKRYAAEMLACVAHVLSEKASGHNQPQPADTTIVNADISADAESPALPEKP